MSWLFGNSFAVSIFMTQAKILQNGSKFCTILKSNQKQSGQFDFNWPGVIFENKLFSLISFVCDIIDDRFNSFFIISTFFYRVEDIGFHSRCKNIIELLYWSVFFTRFISVPKMSFLLRVHGWLLLSTRFLNWILFQKCLGFLQCEPA